MDHGGGRDGRCRPGRGVLSQGLSSDHAIALAVAVGVCGVAILLVVLLLFRPVLSLERDQAERKTIVLLLDASGSMSTADDASGTSRFEQARTRALVWSARLKKDFDLQVVEFSDRAALLDRPGDLAKLKPAGESTSLTRALLAATRVAPAEDVEAVVLLSDGIHNAAGDPAALRAGLA